MTEHHDQAGHDHSGHDHSHAHGGHAHGPGHSHAPASFGTAFALFYTLGGLPLARLADVALSLGQIAEAGDMGLAPTCSTTPT